MDARDRAGGASARVDERCYLESMRTDSPPLDVDSRVRYAKVLVERGLLLDAERVLGEALLARPEHDDGLALLTKIKHIKGELSLALAGWSELHARARRVAPTARLRLAALLHLAQQQQGRPVASDVVDMAPVQVARKPLPYVELEHAFRAWLQRRPDEGRARCRLVSLRCRFHDAELYKLAVLAEAWMAEHSGDLAAACALLEQLGKERNFATDLDRVFTLASLYERVGTRESLVAATHIYRFLARSVDPFLPYAHLADLYRRLGDEESALAAEQEHAREFHARMLRPSPADVEQYLADVRELAGNDESVLEENERNRPHAVGRALAASVYAFAGGAREGLIHEVWAGKEPAEPGTGGTLADEHIYGNLTPEMHKDVKSTFFAVREYARAKLPHKTSRLMDFRYTYKVTKEDEPSGGASAGLPTALAFLSVFTDEPLPQDVAATGQIVTDAHDVLTVHGVGDIAYKLRAACHRNLRALLAPAMNRVELERSPLVPRAVSLEMARFVSTLDDAVLGLFGRRFFR